MQAKLESPIPGVTRPAYLDGTLAGDVGLDPLNLVFSSVTVPAIVLEETIETASADKGYTNLKTVSNKVFGTKPIVLGANTKDPARALAWMREAEVKHSRLAMLAAAGWPLAELWHGGLANLVGAPYQLEVTSGRSLSVLNGGLGQDAAFLFLVALAISAVEVRTLDQVYGLTATGKTMKPNGQVVMKTYVPGDCGFDPLGVYGWYGSNLGVMEQMRADSDPQYAFTLAEEARREMETAEIKNGRLAMLAFTGFIVQAQATGKGPIACWVEHISSPMTTTLVSKGLVTPSTVISPGCAIPAMTDFQGISIPTPCLGLWP